MGLMKRCAKKLSEKQNICPFLKYTSRYSDIMVMTDQTATKNIVLAEDNPADVELTRLAFEALSLPVKIIHKEDGQELLQYLQSASLHEIDLLLLDLNMPKINGIEILKALYNDDLLRRLPVVVLSSSLHESDVLTCYEYGANAYVNKPLDVHEFNEMIRSIANFWIGTNVGPVYETRRVL